MSPRQYFKSILSWWTGAWAVAVTGPLALGLPRLEPPWPEGSSIVAVVFSIVAIAIARILHPHFEHSVRAQSRQLRLARRLAIFSFAATLLMCLLYLYGYSMYVAGDIRRVVGDEVLHAEDAQTPASKLLADNGFDEELVWTRASLTKARLFVMCPFLGIFFFLCLGLGALANLEASNAETQGNDVDPETAPGK